MQKLVNTINGGDHPFEASIKDESTVEIFWRWKDAARLGWGEVTDEVRDFRYFVSFMPGRKYKTSSTSSAVTKNVNFQNGKISFGTSSFSGQQAGMHKEIDLFSHDRKTGHIGANSFDFNTKRISGPVKDIMEDMGYKKKGLFG